MSKAPGPPTRQQLEQITRHICHEVTALIQARDLHDHAQRQKADPKADQGACQVAINCALESFLLHYRALREFLNNKPKYTYPAPITRERKSDDVKASDYIPTWKPALSWSEDEDEGQRLNKRLAHISIKRITLDDRWKLPVMESNALATFEQFIGSLPDQVKNLFELAINAINRHNPKMVSTLADSSSTITVTTYPIFTNLKFK
jgi:hypothetical protein